MYNKLFTKILDSSIWLQPSEIRLVWITLLAAMDEDGYAHFSALQNLADRAKVSLEWAEKAVAVFTSPDPDSANPDYDGKRIERIPGGFIVLNAKAHRSLISREIQRENTRERVRRWRSAHPVTQSNKTVTPSEASSEAISGSKAKKLDSSEPERPATEPEVALVFKTVGKEPEYRLAKTKILEWLEVFPNLEVFQECLKAKAWLEANPARCKTSRGMPRYLYAWLSRAQNNGGSHALSSMR